MLYDVNLHIGYRYDTPVSGGRHILRVLPLPNNPPACTPGANFPPPSNLLSFPGIGRNVFRGPKYSSVDMTFSKRFGIPGLNEGSGLDLRFNFFNIFNNLNLAPFNSNSDPTRVTLTQFGTATTGLAGRVGEFQVRFSF